MFPFSSAPAVLTQFATVVLGGIVTFDPPTYSIQRRELPLPVTFELTVATQEVLPDGVTPKPIQWFDVVPTWDPRIYAFTGSYGPSLPPNVLFPPIGPFHCGIADCWLDFGLAFSPPIPSPVRAGSMTLELPGSLPEGDYRVFVDSDSDQFSSVNGTEGLFGDAFIHVVPEPATLALVACGVAAMAISRRRIFFRT